MTDISIIIRTFNSSQTILSALESVKKQRFNLKKCELIIVDDGSIDETVKLITAVQAKNNFLKMKIFQLHRVGAIKALNFGIKKAVGRWYTILDGDDRFPIFALQSLFSKCRSKNSIGVYGDYKEWIDGKSYLRSTKENIFETLAGGILINREIALRCKLYDTKLRFPEYDLLIKLMKKGSLVHINRLVYHYFRSRQSLTGNKEFVKEGMRQLFEKYGNSLPIRDYDF